VNCTVEQNCLNYGHCPYCIWGSEYRPRVRSILFPLEEEMRKAAMEHKRAYRKTETYRGGKRSQRKGKRLERELARLVHGERVPLSGELDRYPNDVVAGNGWRLEAKGRKDGLGLVRRWLDGVDILALEDERGWLYVARLSEYAVALQEPSEASYEGRLDQAVEQVLEGTVKLEGRSVYVRRRVGGLTGMRGWLDAEGADALCFKADGEPWLLICDGKHMGQLLNAMRGVPREQHVYAEV